MFMNRNHYRDWGAYRHGPVTQNFFLFFLSSTQRTLQHLKVHALKCFVTISLAVVILRFSFHAIRLLNRSKC